MQFRLLPLLILIVVFIIVFGRARHQSKESQKRLKEYDIEKLEWYKYYTGRAEGRILKRRWESSSVSGARNGSVMKEDSMGSSDLAKIVTYEFEVNGKTYTGKGIGCPHFQERKKQTICYNPSNPNENCTLYYFNRQVR